MSEDPTVITECSRCPQLVNSRSQIVNASGPIETSLLFVGEAPGADEDTEGKPFIGRSGAVLTDALEEAGVDREDVRITNAVRCRPPDNRNPTQDELGSCKGYLAKEINVVDPSIVVTLGKVPSEHLLERSIRVTAESGDVDEARIGGGRYRVVISLHPAATLYDTSQMSTFVETISRAVELAGMGERSTGQSGGQSALDDY